MKRGIVIDFETTGIDPVYSSIVQASGVLFDLETFEILDQFDLRARMKKEFSCFHPKAVLVNHVEMEQLRNHENSNYQLISQMRNKCLSWGEAIFFGWNNLSFDRKHLRLGLYQHALPPYLTNTNSNGETDFLKITHAAATMYPNSFVRPLSDSGRITFQLEKFGPANNIYAELSHDSLSDVKQTLEVGKMIAQRCPDVWQSSLKTALKKDVYELVDQDKIFTAARWFRGRSYVSGLVYLGKNPSYQNHMYFFDIAQDPEQIFKLDRNDLKKLFKGKQRVFHLVKSNEAPVLLDEKYLYETDDYKDFSPEELNDRMKKIRSNKQFLEKFENLLHDLHEDKILTQDQTEKPIEEAIYDGFASKKDDYLMQDFHAAEVSKKFEIANKITDIRHREFAKRVLYNDCPDALPKQEIISRDKKIAENHLTLEEKPWITIPQAMKYVDDLREAEHEGEEEIDLVKLQEIDEYLLEMQENFETTLKK